MARVWIGLIVLLTLDRVGPEAAIVGTVPQVHLMELDPDGVEVSQLLAPNGVV